MQVRFLLGPAGSGKTFRCLAEIRQELLTGPDEPLLLLAPKQATFQLERQLLSHANLHGYTRLQILSFDRLAQFILAETARGQSKWLEDEGRIMVLRALLNEKRTDLNLFHATARLPGFATRLSSLLRELQRHQISPQQLDTLAAKIVSPSNLRDKLADFSLLLRAYLEWLQSHKLRDLDCVLDEAAEALRHPEMANQFRIGGIWMDGFAELTNQELDLLAAIVPLAQQATLAFCLPGALKAEPSWLSPWSVIGQTFLRCRETISKLPGTQVSIETLPIRAQPTRFSANPDLAHLESSWPQLNPNSETKPPVAISSFVCVNPEAEATLAAREIRRFVRKGGRFREAAILVRSLDGYADTLRRVFARYDIPLFLDRRECVSHHPLAELTRYALRTAAFGWQRADWFGALKTGLVPVDESEIDWLENVALEHGIDGSTWSRSISIPDDPTLTDRAERLRRQLIPAFATLAKQTAAACSGEQLAAAIRDFWGALQVANKLTDWHTRMADAAIPALYSALHETVLTQMNHWLDNLARAFPTEALPLRDWLPILESGLANLTIGVIPATLDQVLVGAIDRSRNPNLKLTCVLGLNEGVFPATPKADPLLTELERDTLQLHGAKLGSTFRQRIGHEWFYGYIACTRASERLILTCAQTDTRGNKLNRSPFFDHLKRIFPALEVEPWRLPPAFEEVEHISEIVTPAIQLAQKTTTRLARPDTEPNIQTLELFAYAASRSPSTGTIDLLSLPQLTPALTKARQLAAANDQLSPQIAEQLHHRELATSVSALENFAACPFKFFVSHGLRAEERREFELDARERGSFQHEVLMRFHNDLWSEKLNWRNLSPDQARSRIRRIGENLLPLYRQGLLTSDAARRFAGKHLLDSLEILIGVLTEWARHYQFDPVLVEAGFGLGTDSPWPAWRLDLEDGHALLLRGRIDRVDLWHDPASGASLAVVMDYKSSSRSPDEVKLYHGLQLQLPAYLAALEQLPEVCTALNVSSLAPAGAFYVNLRGEFASDKTRGDALADPTLVLRQSFQHIGRFDESAYPKLDPNSTKEQFKTHHASRNRMNSAAFRDLLDRAVENLQRFGNEIYAGNIAPAPFRKGDEIACDFCEFAAICRFDSWTQPFRTLPKPPSETQLRLAALKSKRTGNVAPE